MSTVIDFSEKKLKVVGTSPVRPDGVPKVTGLARYGADFTLPGMLWAKILRFGGVDRTDARMRMRASVRSTPPKRRRCPASRR
jgi:hypothetical protein